MLVITRGYGKRHQRQWKTDTTLGFRGWYQSTQHSINMRKRVLKNRPCWQRRHRRINLSATGPKSRQYLVSMWYAVSWQMHPKPTQHHSTSTQKVVWIYTQVRNLAKPTHLRICSFSTSNLGLSWPCLPELDLHLYDPESPRDPEQTTWVQGQVWGVHPLKQWIHVQFIGLREKIRENPIFYRNIYGFL